MQTGTEQLKSQQAVMSAKNLYNGKIDGIWGPKSIAAKLKWERSGKFSPAIPNNGFPLSLAAPFPPGVSQKSGLLTCAELLSKQQQPSSAPGQAQQPAASKEAKDAKPEVVVPAQDVASGIVVKSNPQQQHGNDKK